jgi:transposase-like protein
MMEARDINRVEQGGGEPEFLSVAQVSRQLGVTPSLVQKWRRLGWLPATRLGPPDVPVYGYRPADVERFVRERWNRRRGRPPGEAGPKSEVRSPKSEQADGRPARDRKARTNAREGAPVPAATEETLSPPVATHSPFASSPPESFQPLDPSISSGQAFGLGTSDLSGQPLVLWDGDPRSGKALILGRFPPGQIQQALHAATAYSRGCDTLVLGQAPAPGAQPQVLAEWRNGRRMAP